MASKRLQLNKALKNASRSAINKMLTKARTAATKEVREHYNIKARDFKKHTKIRRARNNSLNGTFEVTGERFPVYVFGAKKGPKGVSVKIKKKGPRKVIRSSFIQTMPSGKVSVFKRKGKKRLPIKLVRTVAPAQMIKAQEDALNKVIATEGPKILDREMKFYLQKGGLR
jgi:hypothetical protein